MRNPISMFYDEAGVDWSMTRVVAFIFAIIFAARLVALSLAAASLGWPDAFLGFSILFAIPFKDLFSGSSGASLLGKLIDRFGIGASAANAAPETVAAVLDRLRGVDDSRKDNERG